MLRRVVLSCVAFWLVGRGASMVREAKEDKGGFSPLLVFMGGALFVLGLVFLVSLLLPE